MLCLYVCKALLEMGHRVTLASECFDESGFERMYELGSVLKKCERKRIPKFSPLGPYFIGPQRLVYALRMRTFLSKTDADVVFSTQSSPFFIPKNRLFHFVYSMGDLFSYPSLSTPPVPSKDSRAVRKPYNALLKQSRNLLWDRYPCAPTMFYGTGSRIVEQLKHHGYTNSAVMFPPCRTTFRPRLPKKNQVLQIARISPDKRLDVFFRIAAMLPEYPFFLVGRRALEFEKWVPGYAEQLLAGAPRNVVYIRAFTRERPELLEESKVYLYTGMEPGVSVALVEAMAAGCVPFSPYGVGGQDVIETAGAGYLYESVEDAAERIRSELEAHKPADYVYQISERAQRFSPQVFENRIQALAE